MAARFGHLPCILVTGTSPFPGITSVAFRNLAVARHMRKTDRRPEYYKAMTTVARHMRKTERHMLLTLNRLPSGS